MSIYIRRRRLAWAVIIVGCLLKMNMLQSASEENHWRAVADVDVAVKEEMKVQKSRQMWKKPLPIKMRHVGYAVGGTLCLCGLLLYRNRAAYTFSSRHFRDSPPSDNLSTPPDIVVSPVRKPVFAIPCRPSLQQTKSTPLLRNSPHISPFFFLSPVNNSLSRIPSIENYISKNIQMFFKAISSGDQYDHRKSESVQNRLISTQELSHETNYEIDINEEILFLNHLLPSGGGEGLAKVSDAARIIEQINKGELVIETNLGLFAWEKMYKDDVKKPNKSLEDESITWRDVKLIKQNKKWALLDHVIDIQRADSKISQGQLSYDFSGKNITISYKITSVENLIAVLRLITTTPRE
ncbi:MAG: hypothetical protein ACPGC9_01865 [Cytophagales bacterium]